MVNPSSSSPGGPGVEPSTLMVWPLEEFPTVVGVEHVGDDHYLQNYRPKGGKKEPLMGPDAATTVEETEDGEHIAKEKEISGLAQFVIHPEVYNGPLLHEVDPLLRIHASSTDQLESADPKFVMTSTIHLP